MTTPNVYDNWGAVRFPSSILAVFTPLFDGWGQPQVIPASDPCLAVILDFLGVAISTDAPLALAWQDIAGASGPNPIRTIWLHNPNDVVFSSANLPALYLWRESSKQQWDADDWLREHTVVKGLWVFPIPAGQDIQRRRAPIGHLVAKAIGRAIEGGRTPSWVQPGDPEALAATQGSVFYTFAAFDEFELTGLQRGRLDVERSRAGEVEKYPAIDLTFALVELEQTGLGEYLPLSGITATINTAPPLTPSTWAAQTAYSTQSFVVPPTANGKYYQATTAGVSGATAPSFPLNVGSTVADGTVVWTCIGPTSTTIDTGPL